MNIFIGPVFAEYYRKWPLHVIDIGASGGIQKHWKRAEKYLTVIGFEAHDASFEQLKKNSSGNKIYINTALYKENSTVDFYCTQDKRLSSFYKPDYEYLRQFPRVNRFRIEKVTKLRVKKLDCALEEKKIDEVDFIKVDTQGSELAILEGGQRALDNAFGLEIETEFTPMYQGQSLFSDIDTYVRQFGFQLFDLKPVYYKRKTGNKLGYLKGQLLYADALYFLRLDQLEKRVYASWGRAPVAAKLLKSISIALLYGYVDYAMCIFNRHRSRFTDEEIKSFHREMNRCVAFSNKMPDFPGRGKLAQSFNYLHSIFRYPHDGCISQESIGNFV